MQQHGSKYFARAPLPDPGDGVIGQNSTFQNMVMLHMKLKEIMKCSNMVANILPADPSLTLGMGLIGQNSILTEHGHVAYQIKGNHQMQQHSSKFIACRPLSDLGDGVNRSKFNFFRLTVIVMLQNHECSIMVANFLPIDPPPPPPPKPLTRSIGQDSIFFTQSCCISN